MKQLTSETMIKSQNNGHGSRNKAHDIEGALGSAVHNAGVEVGRMATNFKEDSSQLLKSGQDYVKGHPPRSLAIATAFGFVAGGLMTLVLRRKQ